MLDAAAEGEDRYPTSGKNNENKRLTSENKIQNIINKIQGKREQSSL